MPAPYADTLDFLRDHFALLAARLHREVFLTRLLRGPEANDAFLGLFLSEDEIDGVLAALHGVALPGDEEGADGLDDVIAARAAALDARRAATTASLQPALLARLFNLTPPALDVVLMLLAPEVDPRFARVFAYLQDDVTRRWLSPGLALRLLPGTAPNDPAGRALFAAEAPLRRHRLVHLHHPPDGLPAPLIDRPLKLDDRIAEYLLENDVLDAALDGVATLRPEAACGRAPFDASVQEQIGHLGALWRRAGGVAFFQGRPGSGKVEAAAALAEALGRPLLVLDAAVLARRPPEAQAAVLGAARREQRLRGAVLLVRHADALEEDQRPALLEACEPRTIVSAQQRWPMHQLEAPPLVVTFPEAGYAVRHAAWQASLNGQADAGLAEDLAGRFSLTPGQIAQAVRTARQRAWLRGGPRATPTRDDLFDGCRRQANLALDALARKVASPYDWDDLVLPVAPKSQLFAIETQVRHQHTVFQAWGFGDKLALGRGLSALFSGPSGTGKTMAAGILARSLGLDLYKIDLSGVVSKYIGETEKNLSRIFAEAERANVVLFFDEADALFGKRSEVKDAHDRYANIEVSYLLQKMEEYDGIAILATNFSQNLDDAFTRRMQYVIEFPFPQEEDRERIWSKLLPAAAPSDPDIDFGFLARQFELAGGNIKNCMLAAAFQAAADEAPIGMAHLIQGVARELGKLGRPLTRTDFADYYTLARRRGA